uniref:Uncharacterized protein n=1 Tax=Petalonia binghamiae TaxID=698476 RepID=A0A3S8PTX3_9PHAE|nr:hypothetical protein Pbin_030 [Endarachne binghamiae]
MKNKEFSKNNLPKFYYKSTLFKRYNKYGLWFGSVEEFNNITYCEKYLQKRICLSIKNSLLNNVDQISYLNLLTNHNIIKFLDSKFLCYIDFHFLLSFYNNFFLFSSMKSKRKIEIFTDNYYQAYFKDNLEKDFLACLMKTINNFHFDSAGTVLIETNNSCKKDKSLNLRIKNVDILRLFDSIKFFESFKSKKSIGIHKTTNTAFKTKLNRKVENNQLNKFKNLLILFDTVFFQNGNKLVVISLIRTDLIYFKDVKKA